LTRIIIGISVVGVLGFDALSIGVAHVSAVDDADSAALAASNAWHNAHNMPAALQAAEQTASEHGETVISTSFRVAPDGTVRLQIQRDATTLVVRHVHALHSWVTVTASGSGRSVTE
jgi:hypothetical protein